MDEIAAGYGRTSKEKDDGFSLSSQFEAIRELAVAKRITLPDQYEFWEEFSGQFLDRPKLNTLRSLIRQEKVQAIIIYTTDRLSRKLSGADMLLDEFFAHQVKLYIVSWGTYVRDTPEDRLRFNFEATFSDFERRKIAERMGRGKQDKLQKGIYLGAGNPPFGYRKVGQKKETHLEILDDEAAIIRQIYHWYAVDELGVGEIARRLGGTPTPAEHGGKFVAKLRPPGDWAQGTIYAILKNAAYTGILTKWSADIAIPPIISQDLFARTQERLRSHTTSFRGQRYEYLMVRRLTCSLCEYSIEGFPHGGKGLPTRLEYRCPSRRTILARARCSLPSFQVDVVDAMVWDWVRTLMRYPDSLQRLLEESQHERHEAAREVRQQLAHVEERLKVEEKRLGTLVREFADLQTSVTPPAVKEIYRQTKEQSELLLRELTEERDRLSKEVANTTIAPELTDRLVALAATVREDIDTLPFVGRRELIYGLDVRGELAYENGERVLYILWHTHRFRRVLPRKR